MSRCSATWGRCGRGGKRRFLAYCFFVFSWYPESGHCPLISSVFVALARAICCIGGSMHPAVFLMPRVLRLCSGSFHSLVWCLRGHTQPCFILLEFIQETLYQVGSLACIKNVEIHACVYGDSLVCPLEPLVFEIICLIVLRLWGVTTLCVHSNTITLFLFLFFFFGSTVFWCVF